MYHYWTDGTPQAHVFSFQLVWLFSEAVQGAADVNELLRTTRRIRAGNTEDWHIAFCETANEVKLIADSAAAAGRWETASAAYLRAFTYYRSAERVLDPTDQRKISTYRTTIGCFNAGIDRAGHPFERLKVPYDGHELEGYLFHPRCSGRGDPPPCVIFLSGADALPEENFFRGVQYVTERGAACMVFNGPGQGSTLRLLGLPTIADYERPVSAAMDLLVKRRDVDPNRVGLMGVSMAGYYAPRAVCFEHRVKACVAWGGLYDVLNDIYDYYPPLRPQLQWIVGAPDDAHARQLYAAFTLEGILKRVRCPMLITHGAWDRMVPLSSAQRTFDELPVADKELRIYDDSEGGAEHCSIDNWTQVIPYQVDWLLERL